MKPILFSTPMVQAILDGRKTMTRRIYNIPDGWEYDGYGRITSGHPKKGKFGAIIRKGVGTDFPEVDIVPAKYQVGDILWVRETWQYYCLGEKDSGFIYKASPELYHWKKESVIWKPSIFMPKEACRIFLRVTNVRVERLQDINDDDAYNECGQYPINEHGENFAGEFPIEVFEKLWNSINGKGAWEDNPYVFVYEFERVEKLNIK